MKNTNSKRHLERYIAIKMFLNSEKYATVAEYIGRAESSVHNYAKDYRKAGINGLTMHFTTGRPRKIDSEQASALGNVIENKTPQDEGFPSEMN
jgi:putative transposase